MKPRLISDWRRAWRFASVQIAMLAVAWGLTPVEYQAALLGMLGVPAERVPAALGIAFIVARLLAQGEDRHDRRR